MVLRLRTGNVQLRFLVGFAIILASLYALYISRAFRITPELMLVPETVKSANLDCSEAFTDSISACIPRDMGREAVNGSIRFFSAEKRISGSIARADGGAFETRIRALADKPLLRMTSGNISSKSTAEIARMVFINRYNPVFLGIRADIVPKWMAGDEKAAVIFPEDVDGIGFVSSTRQTGMIFDKKGLILIEVNGNPGKPFLSFLMNNATLR